MALGTGDGSTDTSGRHAGSSLAHDEAEDLAALAAFRTLVDLASDAYVILDDGGCILWANRLMAERLGHAIEDLCGLHVWDIDPRFPPARYHALFARARQARVAPFESEHRRRDGSTFSVEVTATVTALPEGERLFAAVRDISERKTALESEARYRSLFESIDDGFCVVAVLYDDTGAAVDGRVLEANPAFVAQTGLVDAVGRTIRELVPDHDPRWFEIFGRVAATGEPTRFDAPVATLGRWYEVAASRSGNAEDHRVAILFKDVMAVRAAERERERLLATLQVERSRLAAVFAQTPSVLAIVRGPEHVLEMANEAYLALNGHRDVLGKPLLDAVPELRGQGFDRLLDAVVATGEPYVGREVPILLSTAPGAPPEERFFDFVYLPLVEPDEHGAPTRVGVIAHGNDITDQVRARREVERARERADRLHAFTAALSEASTPAEVAAAAVRHGAAIFEGAGTIITVLSPSGDALQVVDVDALETGIRTQWERIPIEAPAPLTDAARTRQPIFLRSRDEWRARYPHLLPLLDATGHQANAVVPLIVDETLLGVLGFAFTTPCEFSADDRALVMTIARQVAQALQRARLYDSERQARQEAQQANRTKGEFLAVMSHELRTPLNAIGGYAELIEMGIRGPVTPAQREDLQRIQRSQRHLLSLINEVLNYAKLESGAVTYDLRPAVLSDVVTTVVPLVEPQRAARRITLAVELPTAADHPRRHVLADREKLQQILLNLLSNAVKFTPAGGHVRIDLRDVPDVRDRVMLRVSDTGVGIPADRLDAIFEPFVQVGRTLSQPGEGTGLGLAISRDLARGMGGDITVESTPDVGSTFTLVLPTPT